MLFALKLLNNKTLQKYLSVWRVYDFEGKNS